MKKTFIALSSVGASLSLPLIAFAQFTPNTGQTQILNIIRFVQNILNYVVPIMITVGFIMFAWAVFQFVTNKNAEERAGAQSLMIYSIVGIFVVSSVWGIVALVGQALDIGQGGKGVLPCVVDTNNDPLDGCQGY
jgi:hypothetical protein